jgi:hypothetical protein
MYIGKTLDLKDYRIINILLDKRTPEECVEEIRLPLAEIKARVLKIRKLCVALYYPSVVSE